MKWTKKKLYNTLVDVVKQSGQGINVEFISSKRKLIDELVDDGLVKLVTIEFSSFSDHVFVCLTKGYCAEEDGFKIPAFTFIRHYLDILDESDDNPMTVGEISFIKSDSGIKKYNKWLAKNKEKLEELKNIQYI